MAWLLDCHVGYLRSCRLRPETERRTRRTCSKGLGVLKTVRTCGRGSAYPVRLWSRPLTPWGAFFGGKEHTGIEVVRFPSFQLQSSGGLLRESLLTWGCLLEGLDAH